MTRRGLRGRVVLDETAETVTWADESPQDAPGAPGGPDVPGEPRSPLSGYVRAAEETSCARRAEAQATFRILVTGSRHWTDEAAIARAVDDVWPRHRTADEIVLVHGGARGADATASAVALTYGVACEEHPADWARGPKAGPERNQQMVDAGADVCLAFPLSDSRGTWDCVRRANAAGIPVWIVPAVKR